MEQLSTSVCFCSGESKTENEDVDKHTSSSTAEKEFTHWLMKSEPESRFENGVDVKVT